MWPFTRKPGQGAVASPAPDDGPPMVSFWTYFEGRAAADEALDRLRAQELLAESQPSSASPAQWLVRAYVPLPSAEEDVERYSQVVKAVASSIGGQYDGWEAGPMPDDATLDRVQGWLAKGVGSA